MTARGRSDPARDAGGALRAIARHAGKRAPMETLEEVELEPGAGVPGDSRGRGERPVTIVSEQSWAEATSEIGAPVSWLARRANLLVSGVDLPSAVGRMLQIGGALLEIEGEVAPCGRMDEAQAGLRQALAAGMRAGVWGRVVTAGRIRVGDPVRVGRARP